MSMPLTALSPLVSAKANRNAGKRMLIKPITISVKYFSLEMDLNALRATGKAQTNEMLIRKQAISIAVKPTSPFFIRMYDEPQIRVSSNSSIPF